MKKLLFKVSHIFIPCALVLGACSETKMGTVDPNSTGFFGAVEDKVASAQLPRYLTLEEARLAEDQAYMVLSTQNDLRTTNFNFTSWPKKCSTEANAIYPCPKDNPAQMQGLRDLRITGQVFIIDAQKAPWFLMNNKKDIRSLVIEADKIIIRSRLYLPSTKVQLIADKIIIEEGGSLDVTPADMGAIRAPYKEGKVVGDDGANGIDGSEIAVYAEELEVLGDQNTARLIANGGAGQGAGGGRGQTEGEFAKAPIYAASKTPLPAADIPPQFRGYAGSVLYSGGYVYAWDEFCRDDGGVITNCREIPRTTGARGTNEWPANGVDAVSGGYPGAGGAGGKVSIVVNNINNVVKTIAQVSAGANGVGDGIRKGTLGGLPNPAYKISWRGNAFPYPDTPVLETHTQTKGKDVQSPAAPRAQKTAGQVVTNTIINSGKPDLSKTFFDLKIKRIKELYFSRNFTRAVDVVNDTDRKMDALSKIPSEMLPVVTQLTTLRQSLISQKDYYGRGLQDAPMFAFNFNLAQYQSQVRQAMRAYYLATVFKKDYADRQARLQAVKEALDSMEGSLAETVNGIAQSNNKISNLSYNIELVQQQQISLESDLKQLEEQIRELAEKNVISRHSADEFFKLVDAAAAICQVIPAGQPALGLASTVVKSALKGPKNNSLGGWVDYYKEVKGNYDGYNGKADLEASKKSWTDIKDKFDLSQLKGKSVEEKAKYLQGLYKEFIPVAEKINDILGTLKQPTYSQDEILLEISKIKEADELFKTVSKKLEELLVSKVKIQNDLMIFAKLVDQLTVQMSDYIAVSSKISADTLVSDWADDGVLNHTFAKIAQDAEERALFLFDETVRSYNYLTLENYTQAISAVHLRQKMEEALNKRTTAEAIQILNAFYDVQVDQLKQTLGDRLRQASPLIVVNPGSNKIALTPIEIADLNRDGYVDIDLTDEFYIDSQNTRIDSIEVAQYEFVKDQGPETRFPAIRLGFSLDTKGSLNINNQKFTFFYPALGTRFIWENTFTFQNDEVEMQKNQNPDNYKGIIDSLVDGNQIDAKIFSMHAGLTKMRVKIVKKQGNYQFKKLSIKVNYIYSTSSIFSR